MIDASVVSVRADDTPDAEIEMFSYTFTVLSRGNKKDFDDEKLQEMHHTFAEILNDNNDAQIIFEPANEDFATDGVVEVQVIGEYHTNVLREITDVLSEMGLDVIKALMHASQQPGHHPDHKKTNHNDSPHAQRRNEPHSCIHSRRHSSVFRHEERCQRPRTVEDEETRDLLVDAHWRQGWSEEEEVWPKKEEEGGRD